MKFWVPMVKLGQPFHLPPGREWRVPLASKDNWLKCTNFSKWRVQKSEFTVKLSQFCNILKICWMPHLNKHGHPTCGRVQTGSSKDNIRRWRRARRFIVSERMWHSSPPRGIINTPFLRGNTQGFFCVFLSNSCTNFYLTRVPLLANFVYLFV